MNIVPMLIKLNQPLSSETFITQNLYLTLAIINCFHEQIIASAINVILRSKVWRILFRIRIAIVERRSVVILIILVSLILLLIELIESPLISIRKTMPRILGTQMSEL
jgi:hypothetical protein